MQISGIALEGMHQAQSRVENTAQWLARAADPADRTDLSAEMVALIEARNAFGANANVAKTADRMERRAIDLLA